jgi:hypothetical protein
VTVVSLLKLTINNPYRRNKFIWSNCNFIHLKNSIGSVSLSVMKINFSWKNPMCTMLQNSSILIKSCFYTVVSENCSVFLSIIVFSFVFRIEIIHWGRIALWAVWPGSRSFLFLSHVSTTPVFTLCPWSRSFPCLNHASTTPVFILCPWSRSFLFLNHVSTTPFFIVCPWSRSFPFFKSRFYHVSLYCVSLI